LCVIYSDMRYMVVLDSAKRSVFMKAVTRSRNTKTKIKPKESNAFDAQSFLYSASMTRRIVDYGKSERIYSQNDPATTVLYIQRGSVKLSVVSQAGKEAVVAMLGPGDFFGEGGMAGQSVRMRTATAMTPSTLLVIEKNEMIRVLHTKHEFSDRFISYMLSRNIRTEEDLIDQLFNSSEKRLARALLLLARYGSQDPPVKMPPKVSQEVLAEMIGTTRSRVNFFMKQFTKKGFIGYDGGLHINPSLLSVVLQK
jgi:CRP/FNR family transcriptional regulator, cyclic AMP receptor protein